MPAARTQTEGAILFDPYNDAVVEFPWKPDDPLLYVARAYVKLTVPVDDTEFGGARLVNEHGPGCPLPVPCRDVRRR